MKYCKGSIIRIHLKNFLAFDEIELCPRNKLNLIVGANGSGKSTFVCAIVLGLGGKPSIIGRSPNVSDYVKHGQKEAEIELELYNPDDNNYVIKRQITSNSQSTWFYQGNKVPFKKIETLIEELNIQINNLCQILPQDRVQDFAKMNSKELLENTQKAVGDSEMCEWFHKLRTFRTTIIERKKALEEKIKKYDGEVQRNKRMEVDVKSYEEKKDLLNKISLIEKKLQWLLYEEKNEVRKKMLEDFKSAQDAYEKKKQELHPLLKKVKEAEKSQSVLHNKIEAEKDHSESLNNKLKDFVRNHLHARDKIDNIKQELRSKIDAESEKNNQIAEIQKHIQEMENCLPKVNEIDLVSDIKNSDKEIDALLKKVASARESESEVRNKAMTVNQSVRALEHKVQQLNNVKNKKLEILNNFEDVRAAYDWLQENHDKFQKRVYGPMFMELNVQNPQHARYIEQIVPWRDLVAFVCEDPKDMTNLLRLLRDGKKLKINAIHSAPPDCSVAEMFPPHIPISELRRLGFQSYLIDLVEGPDLILKFLCNSFGLHNIPFGSNQIEDHLDSVPNRIRAFFTEDKLISVSFSKYSNAKIQSVTPVGKSRFLSVSINRDLLLSCTEELTRKQQEYEQVQSHLSEMDEMKKSFDREINSLRNKKRELSRTLEQMKASNVRLRMKREELKRIVEWRIDPIKEEAKCKLEIEACINGMVTNEMEAVKAISDYSDSCTSISLLKMEHEVARSLVNKRESDVREYETSVIAAREEAEKLKSDCVQIKLELKSILKKAKELCEGWDVTDEGFKKKYEPLFRELPSNQIDLQEQLHENEAMAKCLQGNLDEKVLREYEESSKLMRKLEKEVESLKVAASGVQEEADDILTSWLPKIESLIDAINDRFGAFFAAMGCAGVVELDRGPDPSVYENYGLVIKVKFRNEGELQALDSHTQSGGERALTTAVYLLSLQSITKVPFRCVDEINQGMDEVNEKRVYHLIMNSISTCDAAQYFLVTPTLFPNVAYPEGTCVHCVHCTSCDKESQQEFKWSKKNYFRKLGISVDA